MREAPKDAAVGRKTALSRRPGLVVAGATGAGKTALAAAVARATDGELISADSRQIYLGFDAGTNKDRPEGVALHLLDIATPSDRFSAGDYLKAAVPVVAGVRARGHLPIVVGGTGLYIKALLEGLSDLPEGDAAVRAELERLWDARGEAAMRAELAAVDPKAAQSIPVNNKQRLLRALEVHRLTGKPISDAWAQRSGAAPGPWLAFVIEWPPEELKRRLLERCSALWKPLVEETRRLRIRYDGSEPAFEGLGYREALDFVEGRRLETEAYAAFEKDTLAYAKRQRTWFRHQLPGAQTVTGGTLESMTRQVLAALERRP